MTTDGFGPERRKAFAARFAGRGFSELAQAILTKWILTDALEPPHGTNRQGVREEPNGAGAHGAGGLPVATTGTGFPWAGLIDGQGSTLKLGAVETLDRVARLVFIWHGHEAKAPRATGFPVRHDVHAFHGAECVEELPQVVFRRTP